MLAAHIASFVHAVRGWACRPGLTWADLARINEPQQREANLQNLKELGGFHAIARQLTPNLETWEFRAPLGRLIGTSWSTLVRSKVARMIPSVSQNLLAFL